MATPGGMPWRNSPLARSSPSPAAGTPPSSSRPRSSIVPSALASPRSPGSHSRNQSYPSIPSPMEASGDRSGRSRGHGKGHNTPTSTTFAPRFIKDEEEQQSGHEPVRGIEGENDFSGKRYVWLKDPGLAFVRGWVVEETDNCLVVQCDDGSQREVEASSADKVNPAKFEKAGDMAELTHLNEASVVHNLQMRYQADLIYTYSGLFLVAINPYCPLPIYTNEYIHMYKGRSREDTKPHIYAMADEAFRNLVEEGENQSILVTGESGAGKTENTKKVIQYLAAVATSDSPGQRPGSKQVTDLSQQILRANPILESFGNAQTVRNNNSSRFGKFIRIEFTRAGQIAGAFIDWYLLEKSRVVRLNSSERNYHIFYQLLRGADRKMKDSFLLNGLDVGDFAYTKAGNDSIAGVSDRDEWNSLIEAFSVMGFSSAEQTAILRTTAAVLHLGNISVVKESRQADQARLSPDARSQADKVCRLLGIPPEPFIQGLLHPRVKAGREWVDKVQTPEQVRLSIDALAKGIYERGFGDLVNRINRQLDRTGMGADDSHFIGVLDIAGFEIFDHNSFEQLCINYTNEKLQQFFNHHMFVLEQEEYAREQIEWKFIDFGKDLQPTIDLIELPNPIGIFSCLDEDSVMPKATDKSFTDKLHSLWDRKTPKYRPSLLTQGFMLTHYAAEVEYSTDGWLEKNKDPLNDNITRLLATSTDRHVANLFADCAETDEESGNPRSRVKKGLFRTVAQRHKEQLGSLMHQLHSTHPHFVRCIIPNHKKRPKQFSAPLVLDQLRCNGVLEGIRIARTGFPNRLPFAEFRQRYEVLCDKMPRGYLEGQQAARIMLEQLKLDGALYRVGLTKVFFRAGVLAELEEQRDRLIREIISRFQSVARGFTQRRIANKRLYRAEATRIIQRNFQVYLDLCDNPWWNLLVKMKPLLGATRTSREVKRREETIQKLQAKMQQESADRQRLEEERRRADTEVRRIQSTLESERALALDKDEIFRRLQEREAELSEKLAGALNDQENAEDQIDEVVLAKKKAEEKADTWRRDLDQAGQIIGKLEAEKKGLVQQLKSADRIQSEKKGLSSHVASLQRELDELRRLHSERANDREALQQEVKMLHSHLGLKERKLQEVETRLHQTDQHFDSKLAANARELQAAKKLAKDLTDENHHMRQQLSHVSSTSAGHEEQLRRRDGEISGLRAELRNSEAERKALETERQASKLLQDANRQMTQQLSDMSSRFTGHEQQLRQKDSELVSLRAELRKADAERRSRDAERQALKDISDEKRHLQQQLATLTSSAAAHDEALRHKDAEISRLRADIVNAEAARSSTEAERQSFTTRNAGLQQSLRDTQSDLASLQFQKSLLERDLAATKATLAAKTLDETRSADACAQLEAQLKTMRDDVATAQRELTHERQSQNDVQMIVQKSLETAVKDLQQKLVEFEKSKNAPTSPTKDARILQTRVQELEAQNTTHATGLSSAQDKIARLRDTIEKLQTSDLSYQVQAKRSERELRDEREKSLRLERELEAWKGLRVERSRSSLEGSGSGNGNGSLGRNGGLLALAEIEVGGEELNSGSRRGSGALGLGGHPRRQSSNSKGFL